MKALRSTLIVLTGLFLSAGVSAQEHSKPGAPHEPGTMGEKMMSQCKAMMGKHQEMKAKMEELDARLEQKVAAMDAAEGKAKVDAMAEVIQELISQRKAMHGQMMAGMPQMMGHMMGHMEAGMMQGMQMSMADCPMMKGMMGKEGKEAGSEKPGDGGHSEHH